MLRFLKSLGGILLCCALGIAIQPRAVAQKNQYLAGQFLVAAPEMGDPRFAETVIYMINHDERGAMGLVINSPVAKGPLSDLFKALGREPKPAEKTVIVHYGGPVEPERLYILHSSEYSGKGTSVAGPGVAVSGDPAVLEDIAQGKGPRQSLLIFGYAGWAPDQLEKEINAGAWFSLPADPALIFDSDAETKWQRAMVKRKVKA
jgi:putative transcriptional regulator